MAHSPGAYAPTLDALDEHNIKENPVYGQAHTNSMLELTRSTWYGVKSFASMDWGK